ncbi:uncharacterized protein Z519_04164 [Cladophialophora bantiana CBS 173.52]|uniref:Benzoate 4-monooxygenase cytochrome P450 n=1 Tax=Cladophialophora bantiana (strain ATCC 10958 / CBS 173.52 / CDC B-1940 / NIH 8579) TaxID=1442370 RepID=A0A0D2IFN6_CLAB1|nr:uncharacterized protein Z519_04164 [Cladophialophora bantiana CBS 173.52]KIW95579.1 hypothetical protein Z519_04164 [Cladophialophora bantiana CBS 173.52]
MKLEHGQQSLMSTISLIVSERTDIGLYPLLFGLFGLIFLGKFVVKTLRALHQRYGDVVRVGPNEVSLSNWTAYRDIYSRNTTKTEHFYKDTRLTGHENLFTFRNKEAHAARRKLQNVSYSQQSILANESFIAEKVDVLIKRIMKNANESSSGLTTDVYPLCGLFSLEVILGSAFNRHYGESVSGDSLALLKAMECTGVAGQVKTALPFITRSRGVHIPGFLGHCFRQWDLWEKMTQQLAEEFKRNEIDADTEERFTVTPMVKHEDTFLHRKLNQQELIEELMGLTFAGSGTTSTTLVYLIYSLARNAPIQDRLRQELRGVKDVTIKGVQDLPLLSAIIKETLRLYPAIISTLPRVLDRTMTIDKCILPAGTYVGMQNFVHQRDSSVFPEPDDFIPDRWLINDQDKLKEMNAALTPFSVGPRNCIGQNLAKAELYLATGKIFNHLKLGLNSSMTEWDMEMEDRFAVASRGKRLLVDVEVLGRQD